MSPLTSVTSNARVPKILYWLFIVGALSVGCVDSGSEPTPEGTPEGTPDVGPGVEPDASPLAMRLCVLTYTSTFNLAETFQASIDARVACEATVPSLPRDDEAMALCEGSEELAVYETAVAGGRVVIDEAKLDACLQKSRATRAAGAPVVEFEQEVGDLFALYDDADCLGAFVGTRRANEECVQGWDCEGNLGCEASPPDNPTLRCLAPAGDDQICGGTRTCAEGLTCHAGRCAAPVLAGRPCTEDGPLCATGSRCVLTSSQPIEVRTCVADIPPGEACTAGEDVCAENGRCENDVCVVVVPVENGAPCTVTGAPCADKCSVCRSETSNGPTTCQPRSAASGTCGVDDDCLLGLYCTTDTRVCAPLRDVGEACNDQEPCAEDLFCNASRRCAAPGGLNAPCGEDSHCTDAFFCSAATSCRAKSAPGGPCNSTTPCEDGLSCLEAICQAGRLGDRCLVATPATCGDGLSCIVAGPDCPTNDAACIRDNPQGLCGLTPELGEACAGRFNVCGDDAYCPDGQTCVAKLTAGSPCDVDDHCASGLCIEGGTCATPSPSCLATDSNALTMMLFGCMFPLVIRRRRRHATSAK